MGLLNIFSNNDPKSPNPLPSGSFTVDRAGEIVSSTVASSFSRDCLKQISVLFLQAFKNAQQNEIGLTELGVTLGAMNIKAREMRGGAIIFLSPRGNAKSR